MENILLVSHSEKGTEFFSDILKSSSVYHITTVQSCNEARRMILERDFDLVIINAPLRDESGEKLSKHIVSNGISQVILVVKNEFFEAVTAVCEGEGVLTVSKPIIKEVFWSALSLAKSARNRILKVQTENAKLKQKIEDIRIVDRAKCILISFMHMSEKDAHRYIEKQSMDMRCTKREIAEGILKTYEN